MKAKSFNTLFLDRDGVINERNFDGYITEISEFTFLPNVLMGLQKLAKRFDRIIIVTNQQCVGRKIISASNLFDIHNYMIDVLKKNQIHITDIFVAENIKGSKNDRRKPLTKMGFEAKDKYPLIDFNHSIMVGDTDTDIEFGRNLGMKTVLVQSKEKTISCPDFIVQDLNDLYTQLFES